MDIEQVAANTPEILKGGIDPTIGMRSYQASEMAYGLEIDRLIQND